MSFSASMDRFSPVTIREDHINNNNTNAKKQTGKRKKQTQE
jgi:hypothetical protein